MYLVEGSKKKKKKKYLVEGSIHKSPMFMVPKNKKEKVLLDN